MSKVAKWIFPAAGGKDGIIGTVKAAVGFITGNGSLIAAGIAQVAGLGKRKDAGQDRQASVTNMSVGEVPREALLGRVCTGGSLIDAFNHGGQYGTDKVTRCIALCDHAIDAIEGFYVGDVYYAWAGNGAQSAFSNKLTLDFRNATATGYAPPSYAVSGGGWLATDRLCSVTHIWVTTDIDDKVWTQGHPQFRWVLRGLKVYDPRFDPALGYAGASPQTWENRASHTFSENAELLRYAYNRGIYAEGHHGDPAYLLIGRGLTAEEAPPARVVASANLCAEVVSGKMRYAASAVVRAADEFIQVEEMFAAAMAGDIVQREGGIQVEPGQAKSPIYTITDADLVLGETVSFSRFLPDGSEGRRNTVVPSYVEPAQGWKDHAGPVRRSISDILADGGPRELPLSLPFVNDGAQADRNAEIARRLSRLERRAAIVLPPDYSPLEEGDWIAWQSDRYHGGATVRYRIDRWAQNEKWRMALTLREIASSVYGVPDPVSDASDPPPAPPVVAALALSGVSGVAIQLGEGSELPGLRVAWATPDPAVRAILVEVREEGGGVAAPTRIDDVTALTKDVTNGVRAGTDLEFRLTPITDPTRAVTSTAWLPVTAGDIVIAPGDPLPPVSGTPTIDIDTAIAGDGTEVSTLSGSWTAVATASAYDVEIDDGVAPWVESMPTASIKNFRIATGRTYRYRVKAVNRDGVRSGAWSAWSATQSAGGDITAPGAYTSVGVTALARRVLLSWTNPADDDYQHMLIRRNTAGTIVGASTIAQAEGTTYDDTNVVANQIYYYWGNPVDRTGNVGSTQYLGAGTPTFISTGGGDISPTDPVVVTQYGTSALVVGQGPGATAPANRVLNDRFEGGVRTIGQPDGGQFDTGATIASGRLQIVLPFGGTNTMMTFEVVIYDYSVGQAVRYIVGGYTYAGDVPTWVNVSAQYIGPRGFARTVRFAHYLGKGYIWIGEVSSVWNYSVVSIKNLQLGYSNAHLSWESGWSVSLNTTADVSAYVQDAVTTPRAGDQVFGEGLLESPGGAVATRPNFRTDLGVSALVAGQGPLVTLAIPSYANDAAAVAAGRPPGFVYLNTTTGQQQSVPGASGASSTVKLVSSSAGGASAGPSTAYASSGSVRLRLEGSLDGGTLNGPSDWFGEATLREVNSGGTTTHGPVGFTVTNSGLDLGGGVYQSEGGSFLKSFIGTRTGSVTYYVDIVRTAGATFAAGATINASIEITPIS